MKTFINLFTAFLLICSINIANAAKLLLTPSDQIVATGDVVSLDLKISELGHHTASSIGGFDLDISFDTSKLSFLGGSLGVDLGAPDPFFDGIDVFGNIINAHQLSFLSAIDLISNQASTVVLATLDFEVLSLNVGDSTMVGFSSISALGDENGNALAYTAQGATLRNPSLSTVPVPAALPLMVAAIGAVGFLGTRKKTIAR